MKFDHGDIQQISVVVIMERVSDLLSDLVADPGRAFAAVGNGVSSDFSGPEDIQRIAAVRFLRRHIQQRAWRIVYVRKDFGSLHMIVVDAHGKLFADGQLLFRRQQEVLKSAAAVVAVREIGKNHLRMEHAGGIGVWPGDGRVVIRLDRNPAALQGNFRDRADPCREPLRLVQDPEIAPGQRDGEINIPGSRMYFPDDHRIDRTRSQIGPVDLKDEIVFEENIFSPVMDMFRVRGRAGEEAELPAAGFQFPDLTLPEHIPFGLFRQIDHQSGGGTGTGQIRCRLFDRTADPDLDVVQRVPYFFPAFPGEPDRIHGTLSSGSGRSSVSLISSHCPYWT